LIDFGSYWGDMMATSSAARYRPNYFSMATRRQSKSTAEHCQSDFHALGALFVYLLTGMPLFTFQDL